MCMTEEALKLPQYTHINYVTVPATCKPLTSYSLCLLFAATAAG